MLQPDFGPIVKNICHGISGNRTRAEAEEEILGHLEDTYERNIAIGKNEKEAFDASVASLGNTKLLAQQLEAIHAHSPAAQMKSAIWVFIIGFMLQKFHLNLFTGMSLITDFIGMVCWLVSLYLMRKVNKNLKIAYSSYSLLFLLYIIKNCIDGYGMQNDIFGYAYLIAFHTLFTVMWCCAVSGFIKMDNTYCADSEKRKAHLGFVLGYMTLEKIVFCGLLLLNEGEDINSEDPILFIIMMAIYVFILVQFIRLKNRLWDADARYGIDSFNKKSKSVFCTVIALSIICPMCFMYGYAVKDTEKTQFVIHDTDSQTEADAIREQMLKLGIDSAVLEKLPDSEVMNYQDCVSMNKHEDAGSGNVLFTVDIYNFYICDKNGSSRMRTLFVGDIEGCEYRCGFYYSSNDGYTHFEPIEDSVYVSILQKQGSKYYTKPPINNDFTKLYNPSFIQGFDFKAEENQTVIFALSQTLRNYYEEESYILMQQGLVFTNQRYPFSFVYNTVEDFAEATTHNHPGAFINLDSPFMKSYLYWDGTYFVPEIPEDDI